MSLVRLIALCVVLLPVWDAFAARVEIPLRVDLETLREALATRLAATSYREGPCRYLRLAVPQLEAAKGRLELVVPGNGALGVELAGQCSSAVYWRGAMHFTLEPRLDGAGRLRVRIVDSRLADARGSAAPLVWNFAKRSIHPRLERFSFDLGASREALTRILGSAAPAIAQFELARPSVGEGEVRVPIAFDIPDAWTLPPPPPSGAPLSEAELEALEKALEPWDAFLAYVVRQAALADEDSELRKRLFTLLIESRHQLVALLAGDTVAVDPVRALFLDAWSELRELLAPRYRVFVDAGDALAAFQAAAPGLPLSAAGLRQLARSLVPGDTTDPLVYDWSLDRELARAFSIDPIPASPPRRSWLDFFITRAHAENTLERWVPTRRELEQYETRIGALLGKSSAAELERAKLAPPYAAVYRHLVPTTALIESCWRQYVVRGGEVRYLRSQAGSVGIMQINQRVWRGFYDIERVRWDTAYNIRAGAQILLRYLKDYAIPFAERSGNPDYVARAAYAVYNAGPRAVGRFTKSPPHPREARVDERLWSLYRGIAAGGDVDLASCAVKPLRH